MRGKRSTVVLYIQGLPVDVSNRELKNFIHKTLTASGLKTKTLFSALVGDCNILRITDRETGQIEFHGLIEIRPADLAMRAIDILNATQFRGSALAIHRYRQRSPLQRHQGSAGTTAIAGPEESLRDPQRHDLKIELVKPDAQRLLAFRANHRFARR